MGGYAPVCAHAWIRGLCGKPRGNCLDCPNRRFLPITDETIQSHLLGCDREGRPFEMGIYPMLLDESCWFVAVDFDRDQWLEDAGAYMETCRRLEIPAALERSRSGKGGHVWLFFESAISASLGRSLASHLITETMERRPEIGLRAYDRFFPNQNTLPRGGFGNLIALPLQKAAREVGNSIFLNDQLNPYPDQWAFLASLSRIKRDEVEARVRWAERKSRVLGVRLVSDEDDSISVPVLKRHSKDPLITGPLPKSLELVLGNQIVIGEIPPGLRNRLIRVAAFQNPEFYRVEAMRLSVYNQPRIIGCAEENPGQLGLPRGCLEDVLEVLRRLGIQPVIREARCQGMPLGLTFCGCLSEEQKLAAQAMLAHETGVLFATTAFGKTVIGAWLIAQRGVNTLVLVHRRQLLEQWVERLSSFLGVPAKTIGMLGGGRKKLTGVLDVALVQSLVRGGVVDERVEGYGCLVVDECHHLAARSFERVVRRSRARFVTGLSATVTRKDGRHPILFMQCGPVRYRVDARKQAALRPFTHRVVVRPTGFQMDGMPEMNACRLFNQLYEALAACDARNRMICDDLLGAVRAGHSPLLLTERVDHLVAVEIPNLIVLKGGMGKKEWRAALGRLGEIPETASRAIFATGQTIGEGFDDPRLDTLFLALPISWRGTIAQYVGRLHRLHEGKREVSVYDYADLDVPMLARMFDRRCRGYESVGYRILLPASAEPGWPAEVPLPVEPEWKRDYAASVRRLIRDGVDAPLAHLFVHATGASRSEGIGRARSASEAFLYRRLETLPETAGRFLLNDELPIPFDGRGRMEVDFLCVAARLVIELDGNQHLIDAEAYRRDRRKDALLQQNGYFVLRFLAGDAGKRLDAILDTILSVLVNCGAN